MMLRAAVRELLETMSQRGVSEDVANVLAGLSGGQIDEAEAERQLCDLLSEESGEDGA